VSKEIGKRGVQDHGESGFSYMCHRKLNAYYCSVTSGAYYDSVPAVKECIKLSAGWLVELSSP